MFSAWNAKMNTNVTSRASTVTGLNFGRNSCSNQFLPRVRVSQIRSVIPTARGITIKAMTEYNRTMNGTVKDEAPLTRKRTMGANRNSMIAADHVERTKSYLRLSPERLSKRNEVSKIVEPMRRASRVRKNTRTARTRSVGKTRVSDLVQHLTNVISIQPLAATCRLFVKQKTSCCPVFAVLDAMRDNCELFERVRCQSV